MMVMYNVKETVTRRTQSVVILKAMKTRGNQPMLAVFLQVSTGFAVTTHKTMMWTVERHVKDTNQPVIHILSVTGGT